MLTVYLIPVLHLSCCLTGLLFSVLPQIIPSPPNVHLAKRWKYVGLYPGMQCKSYISKSMQVLLLRCRRTTIYCAHTSPSWRSLEFRSRSSALNLSTPMSVASCWARLLLALCRHLRRLTAKLYELFVTRWDCCSSHQCQKVVPSSLFLCRHVVFRPSLVYGMQAPALARGLRSSAVPAKRTFWKFVSGLYA